MIQHETRESTNQQKPHLRGEILLQNYGTSLAIRKPKHDCSSVKVSCLRKIAIITVIITSASMPSTCCGIVTDR